jgi:hypothetical protein
MKDDPDTRHNGLDSLVILEDLARYAEPEDRVRLERTIELVSRARQAVAQARQEAERAKALRKEAEAKLLLRQNEFAALLEELYFKRYRTPK